DVAMHHVQRLPVLVARRVEGMEPARELGDDRGRLYRRQRTIAEQHELPQVHAVDELENEEAVASRLARVDRADGVRMADARGQAGFLEEPRLEVFVIAQVRMDDLDRELARETSRPRQPSEIHGGHASGR